VYSALLNRYPDSHVQRKYADHYNDWIRLQMSAVEKSLRQGRSALDQLPLLLSQIDQAFKSKSLNPGTTADLTVATLLVVFLQQSLNRCFEV
jgi:triphosphoribosyl-dephospho-CoA synthase